MDKDTSSGREILSGREVDYLVATSYIQEFSKILIDFPPIRDIPAHGSFEEYLKKITRIIAGLLPLALDPGKIGVSTVIEQATELHWVSESIDNNQALTVRNDCKLDTVVAGDLLKELALQHDWPVTIEYALGEKKSHAYAIVHVDITEGTEKELPFSYPENIAYLIHFIPFEDGTLGAVNPHGEESLAQLKEPSDNGPASLTSTESLKEGMELFDDMYKRAVEQRKGLSS
jgi:hypothetical protein